MSMPFEVLQDACDALWRYIKEGRPVPVSVAAAVHDGIADLDAMVSAMEAHFVSDRVLAGDHGPHFPEVPTVMERRSAALRRDGNVVWFPLTPRQPRPGVRGTISGCFSVIEGWPT